MPTAVIGLFKSYDTARAVVNELLQKGCKEDDIDILGGEEGEEPEEDEIAQDLMDRGFQEDRAREYGKAVHQGVALVAAEAEENIADQALEIMQKYDVMAPEDVLKEEGAEQEGESKTEEVKAQSVEEEMQVGKRQVSGGKRIRTEVSEKPVEQTVSLKEEHVNVEQQPTDRPLRDEEAEKAFKEENIELKESSEQPVVSKQAHVTGEVTASKETGERQQKIQDTVRKKDVKIEDMPSEKKS